MDYLALRSLIETHPDWPSVSDADLLSWLNTPSITRERKVPISDFVAALFDAGAVTAIFQAAATGDQRAGAAMALIEKVKILGVENIDLSLSTNQSLLSGLVQAGIVSEQQIAPAMALGSESVSPIDAAGLNRPLMGDVELARAMEV